MGNRPLEATSTQHPDTQVPGTSNQPRPKPRRELAYLTRNKPRMYLGPTISTPGYRDLIRQLVQNLKQKPPNIGK
ncbi:unnamed protein product [Penicillium camemberti]|uniref:Str. FM013 n=1 Tax=Penicillium camemberti (strain FM 013) TaxID=1429867 RepID=A0A0G4NU38_PENC3|nr:unnamed protein product [Penicillium camemberti]